MSGLGAQLLLDRCPHCGITRPNLAQISNFTTTDFRGQSERNWFCYKCSTCGGVITASSLKNNKDIIQIYPEPQKVDQNLPERAKEYLEQAINSINSPAGAVMLCASSVDAMLKEKGLIEGTLNNRIKIAAENHLITKEMEDWAHEVRLEANDQRHSDNDSPLPNPEDARRLIDFVQALGTFLFVLPARVKRGIENAKNVES